MRNLLIGILLAGTAITPALAQDNGDNRRHHDQQQEEGHGDGRQRQPTQRQQPQPQPQQQQQQQQQQGRGPRPDGGNFSRQQRSTDVAREQQMQVQGQQGGRGAWGAGRFEGRPNAVPEGQVQVQGNGYRGGGDRNRNGAWNRDGGWNRDGNRPGEGAQQQVRGGWYGQRGTNQQQQYRQGNRNAGGSWNRDWRQDNRYDWRRYRDNHRSAFRLGVYIDPFGYGYRQFGIGYRLPQNYFGQQYWIDPAMFDLPYPPPGTQWVRYWNDALLVDVYSGNVVDVIQGFFW